MDDSDDMAPEEWRRYVNARLRRGNERFDALESQGEEMRAAIMTNTSLTAGIKKDVGDLQVKVQPVLDTIKTMEAGIKTIGRIGNIGSSLIKAGAYTVAFWLLLKLLFLGASWQEALQAFRGVVGK
jgi:hypothetical protein